MYVYVEMEQVLDYLINLIKTVYEHRRKSYKGSQYYNAIYWVMVKITFT